MDAMLRSGFFPENALGDDPAFWIFPGFTVKGLSLDRPYQVLNYHMRFDQPRAFDKCDCVA